MSATTTPTSPSASCNCGDDQELPFCMVCGKPRQDPPSLVFPSCTGCGWRCPFVDAQFCGFCGSVLTGGMPQSGTASGSRSRTGSDSITRPFSRLMDDIEQAQGEHQLTEIQASITSGIQANRLDDVRAIKLRQAIARKRKQLGLAEPEEEPVRSPAFLALRAKLTATPSSAVRELDELLQKINSTNAEGKFFVNEVTILRSHHFQKMNPTRSSAFRDCMHRLENIITRPNIGDFHNFLATKRQSLKPGEEDELLIEMEKRSQQLRFGVDRKAWQPDESCTNCSSCNVEFSLLVRRHHCRNCGKVVCRNCSSQKYSDDVVELEKVCPACYASLTSVPKHVLAGGQPSGDSISVNGRLSFHESNSGLIGASGIFSTASSPAPASALSTLSLIASPAAGGGPAAAAAVAPLPPQAAAQASAGAATTASSTTSPAATAAAAHAGSETMSSFEHAGDNASMGNVSLSAISLTAVGTRPCPSCHITLPSNARFCTGCGVTIRVDSHRKTVCAHCHSIVSPYSSFCSSCGKPPFDSLTPTASGRASTAPQIADASHPPGPPPIAE
eukprot:m.11741 g.11741  ORF g.11741 m.11741 type:complete len:559 (-) comp5917_c0_seq1:132-1808(-)